MTINMTRLEAIAYPAADAMHRDLIENFVFKSCLNCDHMNIDTNVCQAFKVQPPVGTLVYSCGDHWTVRIPF